MKLLLFYAHKWWFKTASKSLPDVPDVQQEDSTENTVVVFYHAEKEDEEKGKGVLEKLVKNIKWLAGKFGTKHVVIHSFNHLSSSKASPEFSEQLINQATERLQNSGYTVRCTARSVAAANREAVALVFVQFPDGSVYTGTAFAVRSDPTGGHLVTNRHVVSDSKGTVATKIGIVFEGTRQNFRADVVRIHPEADVALLRATVHKGFPVVAGLDTPGAEVQVGAPVALIGFPLGLELAEGGSWAEMGVASSLTLGTVSRRLPNLVQVEGYGAQGSSGSPIFDGSGRVVAVLYGGQTGTNGRILYGVPVRFVHQLLEDQR